ncbi:crotonobetainyl-CoA:carnitine CoA-transferase CaiB-like acyl-CoA transferase [Humitalea rosea]|uniref:Crotonobetainyl-CoA:carnitine CoA-transferase CaiB-like acyl-CoA transferase n=1 Tax=Humitalea rosea TaxID=990373 RepID=A0A2W7KQ39_9PROT|nr:CaiB/BaiF CoA-transferase family protein [Humitalea rosea]PZW50455.1 crotonobetainyl-CoA:carnitine CoA-transferase CaiB-like acyl-CoA transferase [Humitalea rosea]
MSLPLAGLRILDFGHTIMGPSCGVILADLGAEVIRVEPPGGDRTRRLGGFGVGFFGTFNRNKRSLAVDLKDPRGKEIVLKLVETADAVVENFAPGTMERLGLDAAALARVNPRLVYCSLKGYLPGPYENLPALDEVVQMQGGLAFMTGPPGRPLRAGASVVDIMGGMFGVIGILAALHQREITGKGQAVAASLFETVAFLVAQHMAAGAISGTPLAPMTERRQTWAIYDIFEVSDGQVFVGVVSDQHWQRLVAAFPELSDLGDDPGLATNSQRVTHRDRIMPRLTALFATMTIREVMAACNAALIPAAPVNRPDDLFLDPHLLAGGGMPIHALTPEVEARLPVTPIVMGDGPLPLRTQPPVSGHDTAALLAELGFDARALADAGVVQIE